MMALLNLLTFALGLAGVASAVLGLVLRRQSIRLGLIFGAAFYLLIGGAIEARLWSQKLDNQRHVAQALKNGAQLIATARATASAEVRDLNLRAAEVELALPVLPERNKSWLLSDVLALLLIAIGSGRLCLAVSCPEILMTRRERDAQIITTTALAPQRG